MFGPRPHAYPDPSGVRAGYHVYAWAEPGSQPHEGQPGTVGPSGDHRHLRLTLPRGQALVKSEERCGLAPRWYLRPLGDWQCWPSG